MEWNMVLRKSFFLVLNCQKQQYKAKMKLAIQLAIKFKALKFLCKLIQFFLTCINVENKCIFVDR